MNKKHIPNNAAIQFKVPNTKENAAMLMPGMSVYLSSQDSNVFIQRIEFSDDGNLIVFGLCNFASTYSVESTHLIPSQGASEIK